MNDTLSDWLEAEREYLAQRPADGSIPRNQLWHEDTVPGRAYQKYLARTQGKRHAPLP